MFLFSISQKIVEKNPFIPTEIFAIMIALSIDARISAITANTNRPL